MGGEETPENREALSRRNPWPSNLTKLICGARIGLIIAFALALIVNALR